MDPQPDVIWGQSNWSGEHLHDLGIPMIVNHHDSRDGQNIRVKRYHNVVNRFLSRSQMRLWSKHKPWINEQTDAFALWYGFRPDEFQLTLEKTPNTVIFVGSLKESKGLNEYLELATMNPDWTFYIYGRGDKPQHIAGNVKFMGELKRGEEHRRVFAKASRFFMYVKWEEVGITVGFILIKRCPED